jgi:hypothetical protein
MHRSGEFHSSLCLRQSYLFLSSRADVLTRCDFEQTKSLKFGSTILVIGLGKDTVSLPVAYMSAKEIDLKFQFRYANQYPRAIRQ